MSNTIKMNNTTKIIRSNPVLPALPQMFGALAPPPLKPMPYNGSFLTRKFEKWRLEDIRDMHSLQADIAEAQLRQTKAMSAGMHEAATFGPKLHFVLDQIEHERKMMGLAETEKHYDIILKANECKLTEKNLEKVDAEIALMLNEVKLEDIDCQLKMKELQKLLKEEESHEG